MKKLFILIALLTVIITINNANAQTKFGFGVSVGEIVSGINRPAFGPNVFLSVSSSIKVGATVGFVTISPGDEKKVGFKSASGFLMAPYVNIGFAKMKGFEPYVKITFAYASTSIKNTADVTADANASSLWGAFGFAYDVAKGVNVYGHVRLIDFGISGDTKTTSFGLGSPAMGVDFEL